MSIYANYLHFDLLSIPISLSYKKKYLYSTFVGATLTIICAILIILFLIIKLNQILSKSQFTIISNEYQNPKGEIDFSNIPILFTLADNNGNPIQINSKIFEFSVVSSEYVQKNDINGNSHIINIEKDIEIERCDNLTDKIDFSYFSEYNLSYFTCIKPNQNLTIKGIFRDIISGFKHFRINIKKCNNLINCYSNEYIDSFVYNTKLIIVYLGYKTNFYNLKNDIEQVTYSRSFSVSPFFRKKIFYYMTLGKYEIYDDLILNNKKENIFFINKDILTEINPNIPPSNNTEDDETLAFFSFVYDGNMIIYTKKVEKIGEILSYIGNIFNIILTLIRIINNYYSNKILFIDIFCNFFFEDKFKKKEKNVHFDNSHLFLLMNKKVNNSKMNLKVQEKSINSNINLNSFLDNKLNENNSVNISNSVSKNIDNNISIINRNKNLENNSSIINRNKNINLNLNININNPNINNNKSGLKRILTNRTKIIEKEKIVFLKDSRLYFLCPLWVIRKKSNLNHLLAIKESICNSISLENFIEFIKIKKNLNGLSKSQIHGLFEQRKNHLSDKNIRAEVNDIFNNK